MKKNKNSFSQNYTEKDLQTFETLEDFKKYNRIEIETHNKQNVDQSVYYSPSDNRKFVKLTNFKKDTNKFLGEYFIRDLVDNYSLNSKEISKKNNSIYNESDLQGFEKLKQLKFDNSSDFSEYNIKKKNFENTKISYTKSDIRAFNRILGSKENFNNSPIQKRNDDVKNLQSQIDISSIKVVDFDKLKQLQTQKNKEGLKKIKVIHFD